MLAEKKLKNKIKIDREPSSGLSAFTERPIPTETEVASFERVVEREVRHQEIDSNLSEIYKDNKGDLIDVKKMSVKKRQAWIIRVFKRIIILGLLSLIAYFCYFYFFVRGNDMSGLEFLIAAPEKVVAGEEFSYAINYTNPTKFPLSNLYLELKYPENFIFLNSSESPTNGNYGFNLADLPSGATRTVTVTGTLVSQTDSVNVVSGRLSYIPINFSSEFKKESSDATIIEGFGFQAAVEAANSAFVNQDNELALSLFDVQNNQFADFNLEIVMPEGGTVSLAKDNKNLNASSTLVTPMPDDNFIAIEDGANNWKISGLSLGSGPEKLNFIYQFKEQPSSSDITIKLSKKLLDGQKYVFWEKTISPELVKSDLNLTLFLNGSKNNGTANFGDTLNYTLAYSNKGDNTFKDAVIMVVLNGFFLDWNSFKADQDGEVKTGKMIVWTKNDISALSGIKPGDAGEINFSIKLKDYLDSDFGSSMQINSYSQYGVNNQESGEGKNSSNIIETKINSDLYLSEQIRYFDDNNLPVGSGPLPPKVGEKSSFKVFWTVKNNLHELRNAEVILNLPNGINWDGNSSVGAGTIYYDESRRLVIWNIGQLPVSIYQTDASFSVSVTPSESDRDKILILSPGSTISASDNETQAVISRKTGPKTTKLEDDDIASLNNSGRVE